MEVWDPETREFLTTIPGQLVMAAWGNRVVTWSWEDSITRLIDLDTGFNAELEPPEGIASLGGYGAFSCDGSTVAVIGWEPPAEQYFDTMALVLIDFEEAAIAEVAASRRSPVGDGHVTWSPDGTHVFLAVTEVLDETGAEHTGAEKRDRHGRTVAAMTARAASGDSVLYKQDRHGERSGR